MATLPCPNPILGPAGMAPLYFPGAYAPDGCGFGGAAPGFAAPCYAGHALVGYAYYAGAPAPYAGAHGPYGPLVYPPQQAVGHLVPPGAGAGAGSWAAAAAPPAGAVPGHAAVRLRHGQRYTVTCYAVQ